MNLPDNPSLAQLAYERLRTELLHGELMPGERLRAADLEARYRLGLTPIREAIMRLASEGLVTGEPHRGWRASTASPAEFADLMATRREIERLCLGRAIALGDTAWEAEIVAAMHMLSRLPLPSSPGDRAAATRWEVQHRRFHTALVAACGSEWLLRFWNTLADHSERYRKLRLLHHAEPDTQVRDVNGEHAAIMQAVLSRDAELALTLLDTHLLTTQRAVARLLESRSARAG